MEQYYKELGCKVRKLTEREMEVGKLTKAAASQHRIAELKIPLQFPKTRIIPRGRR